MEILYSPPPVPAGRPLLRRVTNMNKVLAFLEKNVQWIALGLGGLIFMYAIYAYWLVPGLSVEVAGQDVGPAGVDEVVREGPGRQLRTAIDNPRRLDVNVPDLTAEFVKNLGVDGTVPTLETAVVPGSPLAALKTPDERASNSQFVSALAVPAPAKVTQTATGKVNADVPQTPPAGNAQPVAAQAADLAVVQVLFRVPVSDIAESFRQTALSPKQQSTMVLQVMLQRERLLPDGTYGETTQIAKLNNNPLPAPPAEKADMDAKRQYANRVAELADWVLQPPFYDALAGDDPTALPETVAAEGEDVPAPEKPAAPANGVGPDGLHPGFVPGEPSTYPPASEMTKEERQALRDYLKNKNKPNNGGNPYGGGGGNPYGGGGGGPYGGGPGASAAPGSGGQPGGWGQPGGGNATPGGGDVDVLQQGGRDQRPGQGGEAGPGAGPRGYGPGGAPPRQGGPSGTPGGGGPYDPYSANPYNPYGGGANPYNPYGGGNPAVPGQPAAPQGPDLAPPPGTFNPSDFGDRKIEGWAWDTSAKPGETYRYRVVYALRNPLFDTSNIADKAMPQLTEQLLLTSAADATEWGPDIKVQALTEYYMTGNTPDDQQVLVTVFHWQDGRWQGSSFKVAAGDPVGQTVGGVKFATGVTLVDVRRDLGSNGIFGLMVDDQGRFTRRTSDDSKTDEFKKRQSDVNSATANATPATPGNGYGR